MKNSAQSFEDLCKRKREHESFVENIDRIFLLYYNAQHLHNIG